MIKWKATSVNGLVEYEQEAESFKELFDELDERGIISDPDFPLYDAAILEKYGKSFDDADFKDESGDLDYGKVDYDKVCDLTLDIDPERSYIFTINGEEVTRSKVMEKAWEIYSNESSYCRTHL